jgi:hypothetical protein
VKKDSGNRGFVRGNLEAGGRGQGAWHKAQVVEIKNRIFHYNPSRLQDPALQNNNHKGEQGHQHPDV